MPSPFRIEDGALVARMFGETLRIEPHGPDALRVRARPGLAVAEPHVSALLPPAPTTPVIDLSDTAAHITNGRLRAEARVVPRHGADQPREVVVRFVDTVTGQELLAETRSHFAGPGPRAFKPLSSGSFQLEATFAAQDGERLMGLGQPQHGRLDLKGVSTTLIQQNTHVVIPFVISSRGYGFLWNNPATGRCDFAANVTRWRADATPGLDYWICAGETPAAILNRYLDATGRPPMLPDWATGFWQCKLRYRTQDELLGVARQYRQMGLPLSCIVIDFFAWTRQGEWQFDPNDWPDPEGLVRDLADMGVQTMVSIWPTVGLNADTWREMREWGMILRTERGVPAVNMFPDKDPYGLHFLTYYDAFDPAARDYHWARVRENYLRRGFRNFWLDSCEPEIRPANAENIRTCLGNGAEMLLAYPKLHADRYAQGLAEEGITDGVLLTRSTWAGGQRAPIILWSGDVWSRWEDLRAQIAAGCHAAASGIGWWTTDIGGFYDGHGGDPAFHELLLRWFEFGVFSPICRLHGFRIPDSVPPPAPGEAPSYGPRDMFFIFTETGGDNEVWSYGPDVLDAMRRLLDLRERLRPYIGRAMHRYHTDGIPPMRAVAFDYPDDPAADAPDQYLFGDGMLVAPVVQPDQARRRVCLPEGTWVHAFSGQSHAAGWHDIEAPLGCPPVFLCADAMGTVDWSAIGLPNPA
jgi:alpha-D-xyloside xylohydrolase